MNGDVIPMRPTEPEFWEKAYQEIKPLITGKKEHYFMCYCCGHWLNRAVWPARGCEACKGAA